MSSEAKLVEIKAYLWNEGQFPSEMKWEGKADYDSVRTQLCNALYDQGKEFGKLVLIYPPEFHPKFTLFLRAIDDEFRGRQLVAGVSLSTLEKNYQERQKELAQKVFSPKELYALEPTHQTHFIDFVDQHLREIDSFTLDYDAIEATQRVTVRTLVGLTNWSLKTIWFDEIPVMVLCDAEEHHQRWVTNSSQFIKLLQFLQEFTLRQQVEGQVDENTILPALTEFGHHTIHDFYNVAKQKVLVR